MKLPWWLRALARVPLPVLHAVADVLAFVVHRLLRYRVGVARANLQACFPAMSDAERNRIVAANIRNTLDVLVETLSIAGMEAAQIRARVRFMNMELAQREISAGRSVILLAAHHCNWEWVLQGLALDLGVPLNAAYKPLHNETANALMLALRTRFGARMVVAKMLLRVIVRMRGEVQAVAFVADQVPRTSVTRHWITFFGRDTAFYPGPAQIALRTGFATFFVRIERTRRGYYQAWFEPLTAAGEKLEAIEITQRYAARVEAVIRDFPADWAWTHRRWKLQRSAQETAMPGTD